MDTGAAYSVVPAAILEQLGIEPDYTERFGLADGSEVELGVGKATMVLDDRARDIYVVFGRDDRVTLVGSMTLECFALAADAGSQRLVPALVTV